MYHPREVNKEYDEEYDAEEEPNLASDLTEDHHPNRLGDYELTEESGEDNNPSERRI